MQLKIVISPVLVVARQHIMLSAEQAKIKNLDKNARVYAFLSGKKIYLTHNNKLL